jgi:hypothetical protein
MQTFAEQVLESLGPEPVSAEKHNTFGIDFENVRRVLLRDGWHTVYRTTKAERDGLAVTLKNLRKKLDNPNPAHPKTDEEMIAEFPQFIPYAQNPKLQPKPFRRVLLEGSPWAVWNESRDPIPVLAELMVPWHQILALDVEQPR